MQTWAGAVGLGAPGKSPHGQKPPMGFAEACGGGRQEERPLAPATGPHESEAVLAHGLAPFPLFIIPTPPQFLVQLKIMDYSLLLGIHEVPRAEEEDEPEDEDGGDNGTAGLYGASPEGLGIAGDFGAHRALGPGDFDSRVDVYAVRSQGEQALGC